MTEDIIKKLKIVYYADLLIRHRSLIIMVFSLSIVAGIFYSMKQPIVYQASTLIKVIPRSVPEDYVTSVIEEEMDERRKNRVLEIKSRTNIEKIIAQYKLFEGDKYKHMYQEDKVVAVYRNISVNRIKSQKNIEYFRISYKGDDPEKVMKVVNLLAESFINESIRVISDEVVGTKDFLESELKDKGKRLDGKHEDIKKYREEHLGELPEQLESNLRNLERLQEKQISKSENLRDAKNKLIQLDKDMAEALKEKSKLEKKLTQSDKIIPESEDQSKLQKLTQQYILFSNRYTDKHPEMIKLRGMIEQLKTKNIEKTTAAYSARLRAKTLQMKELESDIKDTQKEYSELERERNKLIREIQIDQMDIRDILKQTEMYEKRVENTPKVELELKALEQNLEPVQKSYDSLLEKREDAVLAVKMEKGEKFRIIDAAKKPQKPISPDMKKLFLIFAGGGFFSGIGLTLLSDFFDTTVRRPNIMEKKLEVPVLVIIPKIYKIKDKLMIIIRMILTLFYVMIAFVLFFEFFMLSFLGLNRTLHYMKKIAPFLPI